MFVRWDCLSDHSEPTKCYQNSKAASPGVGKLKANVDGEMCAECTFKLLIVVCKYYKH